MSSEKTTERLRSGWQRVKDVLPKVLFGLALLLSAFALGVITTRAQLFPYGTISTSVRTFKDLRAYWKNDLEIEPTRHLKPARHPGAGVTIKKSGKMQPGATFMVGFFGDGIAARLVSAEGEVLNTWPIRYTEIWPDAGAEGTPVSDWNALAHGAMAFPDGSIVVTGGRSLVNWTPAGRLCGKTDATITIRSTRPTMARSAARRSHRARFRGWRAAGPDLGPTDDGG